MWWCEGARQRRGRGKSVVMIGGGLKANMPKETGE
jgi:hypothetical protein